MNTPARFVGKWRIGSMEAWDRDALERLGPACFEFEEDGLWACRFIAVQGQMDGRFGTRDGMALVEFSWDGQDELDPTSGRGRAVLDGVALAGRIHIHVGDDSTFTAVGDGVRPRPGPRRGKGGGRVPAPRGGRRFEHRGGWGATPDPNSRVVGRPESVGAGQHHAHDLRLSSRRSEGRFRF